MKNMYRCLFLILLFVFLKPVSAKDDSQPISQYLEMLLGDIKVNDPSEAGQVCPNIAVDDDGNFVIVWIDDRNAQRDIFAQRFDYEGNLLGGNFRITEDSSAHCQSYPSIGMDGDGSFTVVWYAWWLIYARRFDSQGNLIGNIEHKLKIEDYNSIVNPVISMNQSGDFVIVWKDGNSIFAQKYFADGTQNGSSIKITSEYNTYGPQVVLANSGEFIVTWTLCNGTFDVYARIYSAIGVAETEAFPVHATDLPGDQYAPQIALAEDGKFIIVWADKRNGNFDCYAQLFAADGSPDGDNFKINDDTGAAFQGSPAVSISSNGAFIVSWTDMRRGNNDIYAQLYAASGAKLGKNFKINGDVGKADQHNSHLAFYSDRIYFTWHDDRLPMQSNDIFARAEKFNFYQGCLLSGNVKEKATGLPLENIPVKVQSPLGDLVAETTTDANGDYSFNSLLSGNYYVWADGRREFQPQYYPFSDDLSNATAVTLAAPDSVSGINFELNHSTLSRLRIADTSGVEGSKITVPVVFSTDSLISDFRFTFQFDSSRMVLNSITNSETWQNYTIFSTPFIATGNGAYKQGTVSLTATNSNLAAGLNQHICHLNFSLLSVDDDVKSQLFLLQDSAHTRMITADSSVIFGDALICYNGELTIRSSTHAIAGKVTYLGSQVGVQDAFISAQSTVLLQDTTNAAGNYRFNSAPIGMNQLAIVKASEADSRIAGSDVVLLLEQLAFKTELESAQRLAADVTGEGALSGADAMALLRYLVFYENDIAKTGLWRFFPTDTTIVLAKDETINWQGCLLGDVNLDWANSEIQPDGEILSQPQSTLAELYLTEFNEIAPGEFSVPVYLNPGSETVKSMLFSISYDTTLYTLKEFQATGLIQSFVTAVNRSKKGCIHAAMADVAGLTTDGEIMHFIFGTKSGNVPLSGGVTITRAVINDRVTVNLTGVSEKPEAKNIPTHFQLQQNYPNPFNPTTAIRFDVPKAVNVKIDIFNILGQHIRTLVDKEFSAGYFETMWDGKDRNGAGVASGVYIYVMQSGQFTDLRKMILLP